MAEMLCDACRQPADPEHIARRLRRLELATRFRPIHIGVLFLAEAPPPGVYDYLYACGAELPERSAASRLAFESLLDGAGIAPGQGTESAASWRKTDEARLAEFQKRGYFLAHWLECPREEIMRTESGSGWQENLKALGERFAPVVLKRLQFSYQPRRIALISTSAGFLIPFLEQAGLGERLLLHRGRALELPREGEPRGEGEFRAGLAEMLSAAAM